MSIKKYIPDFITSLNLACGVVGVVFAFEGRVDISFLLMLAAAVFDFCDGLAARALDAYSDLGKELDSLSDLVSFGVLPSVMMYNTMVAFTWSRDVWVFIPLLLAVFSGIRLAKFNVDERQHMSFIGLATPMSAMLCGSLCSFVACNPVSAISVFCAGKFFLPVLTVVLCYLMLCEIPMFSMKFSKGQPKELKTKRFSFIAEVVVILAVVLVLGLGWQIAITFAALLYILKNVVYALFKV